MLNKCGRTPERNTRAEVVIGLRLEAYRPARVTLKRVNLLHCRANSKSTGFASMRLLCKHVMNYRGAANATLDHECKTPGGIFSELGNATWRHTIANVTS
jgi:hypothetical protein